ncbi:MAG: histidinol-phosphate aminotransferase family protein [Chloroflexi bacterium]|nr:histidinol-phosphate aminotransferase family protein [Chloroflexota bacterium]
MPFGARPHIQSLTIGVHGGIDFGEIERLGLRPEEVLDFSVNANPWGPPPGVRETISRVAIDRYPDPEAKALRRRLASVHEVDVTSILVTNGSVEAIWCACLAFAGPGDCVLICGPTFGEYEVAARMIGAEVVRLRAKEEDGFQPDVSRILLTISQRRPRMVFLCNPNNPTGVYLSRDEVEAILDLLCQHDGALVLDEAYVDFVRDRWSPVDMISGGHLLILRSLTKNFALAGLRLGYVLAEAELVSHLRRVKPPWSVNAVALEAGLAALSQAGFVEGCLESIWRARDYLAGAFRRQGFSVVDSSANFFIARVGDARGFRAGLLEKGCLVRDCTSFGLPKCVRVSPRRMNDCERLVQELDITPKLTSP